MEGIYNRLDIFHFFNKFVLAVRAKTPGVNKRVVKQLMEIDTIQSKAASCGANAAKADPRITGEAVRLFGESVRLCEFLRQFHGGQIVGVGILRFVPSGLLRIL